MVSTALGTLTSTEPYEVVSKICEKYNLNYDEVHYDINEIWDDTEDLIQADMVIYKPNVLCFYCNHAQELSGEQHKLNLETFTKSYFNFQLRHFSLYIYSEWWTTTSLKNPVSNDITVSSIFYPGDIPPV